MDNVLNDNYERFTLKIEDDFNLDKIADCGQCFRARVFEDGTYRFITGRDVIYIKELCDGEYGICCRQGAWDGVWKDYFDLTRNYKSVRESVMNKNEFVDRAVSAGAGIRVLRQDKWEMLITFIISQRKNIPAIARAVETLCDRYGKELVTEYETLHAFPAPEALYKASPEELRDCGLGYRTAYVRDAAEKVVTGMLNLSSMAEYGDEELFGELLKVHGVGRKVANCVCLFGYGRMSRVPVDVWIERAIQEEWHGNNPFDNFGDDAGIIQQYVFYYERNIQNNIQKKIQGRG